MDLELLFSYRLFHNTGINTKPLCGIVNRKAVRIGMKSLPNSPPFRHADHLRSDRTMTFVYRQIDTIILVYYINIMV